MYHKETNAIRSQNDRAEREHSVPLYLTSSFVFDDAEQARALFADEVPGNIYTRFSNPNANEFVAKMCQLEGAEDGLATASGMSAVFTSIAGLLRSGDHLLASRALFGSSVQILTQILPRFGITFDYVDATDVSEWQKQVRPETKMLFLETPSNPGLELVDLEAAGAFAGRHGLILNVDNCFATPYIQTPVANGAHLVTHSATKWIDGQGRGVGGVILGRKDLIKELRFFARHTGPAMSPFNAWMFSKSLETLSVRMRAHCVNAIELATRLEAHPSVEWVRYPHLPSHPQFELAKRQMAMGGGLLSFNIRGGSDAGRAFLDTLTLISHTANLGDTRTIATHPASTTHSKLSGEDRLRVGIHPGMIRISAGLEHIEDLWADISQALDAI
jgi:O-succinylhomoserine sulfhydrylase